MKKKRKSTLKELAPSDFLILAGASVLTLGLALTWPRAIPYFWGIGLLLLGIYKGI